MISLRRAVRFCLVLGFALAACDRAAGPTQPLLVTGPSASVSNSAKHGQITARILVDGNGVATLEVRTGQWDNATNTGAFDGSFTKIQYKVYDERGKQILERNRDFKKTAPTFYTESISLCKAKLDDDDSDDNKSAPKLPKPPCGLPFSLSWTVQVKASLKGVQGDPKKSDEVRAVAGVFNNPDVDLAATQILMVIPGPPSYLADLGQVETGTAQTYSVQFYNSPRDGATVGVQANCEVHVFQGTSEVTPGGLTYLWIPNDGSPAYDATVPGSQVSAPVMIAAANVATCQFTMSLPNAGNYRIEVTANTLSPLDFDLSNNTVSGIVQIVAGTPVTPPPSGGPGNNATADDHAYFGPVVSGVAAFLGDSSQRANIDNLSSTVLTSGELQGTYTLKIQLYTIDGPASAPTATRNLAKATWTGSLPDIAAAASGASLNCVSSTQFGTMTPTLAANGNVLEALMCVVPSGDALDIGLSIRWRPATEPPAAVTAAMGAQYYGDILYFDTDLKFSDLPQNPVSHAPVTLSQSGCNTPDMSFGATTCVNRFK